MPHERQRLFDLITKTHACGVLIISGDRHWAELSVEDSLAPYPIYDLTSSSLNQIHPRGTPTVNRHRAAPLTYHRENFGVITIDWKAVDPQLTLQILDIDSNPRIERTIRLSELHPPRHQSATE